MYWTGSSVKLFRQDLEDLIELFRKIAADSTTVLSGEDSKTYESFEDMKSKEGNDVSRMTLRNPALGIAVRFSASGRSKSNVSSIKDTKESELAFYRARDFLEAHRRRSGEIVREVGFWIWGVVIFFTIESLRAHSDRASEILFFCLLVSVVLAAGSWWIGNKISYMVTLDRKHERPPFFIRKKDDLILALVISVTSTTLGILGTLVVQHFTKK
jgi:hypothetical protein